MMKQDKLLYFDLETTGTDPQKHGVIQLAALIEIGGFVVGQYEARIAPFEMDHVEEAALKVSGADIGEIYKRLHPAQVYQTFIDVICKTKGGLGGYINRYDKADKFHLVGYNILGFDIPFLRQWFLKNNDKYFGSYFWHPGIDVMALAAEFVAPYRHTLSSFKLADVCRSFGIEVQEDELHDALYDVYLTRELYQTINRLRAEEGGKK
jgi:DNA polymerase-3 subunit epsilon